MDRRSAYRELACDLRRTNASSAKLLHLVGFPHADFGSETRNDGVRAQFSLRNRVGRSAMLRSLKSAALWATLTLVVFCCAPDHVFAASPNGAANPPEQTTPQGQDPPGTDNGEPTAPMVEHKGVIEPPPTGDEGINTNVPNPNAGHEGEVIPPPGTPVGDLNVEPR